MEEDKNNLQQIDKNNYQKMNTEDENSSDESKSLNNQETKPIKIIQKRKQLISPTIFVSILGLVHGLVSLADLAAFMYQKNELKLQPETIQLFFGIVFIPWCIKPVFGYLSDKLVIKMKKAKYIVYITATSRVILFLIIAFNKLNIFFFYALYLLMSISTLMENILAEYILVLQTKEENEQIVKKNLKQHANQLPIYFGCRALGTLVGKYFGGRIIKSHSNQYAFFLSSFLPLIIVLTCFFYDEDKKEITVKRTFKYEIKVMKELIFRKSVLKLVIFIFLINLTPNFDSLVTFYLTDYLKFNTKDLADFQTFATVCYLIGLLLYSFYFKNVNPMNFYLFTNFLLWFSNFTFLVVIFHQVDKLGISKKLFCMFSQGLSNLVQELNFMPILAIWCRLCPENLEATSITLFTGFINLSSLFSNYFGSFLIWLLGIHKQNYDKMWIPICIQNTYLFIMIIAILFVKFPELKKVDEKEEIQEIEMGEFAKKDKTMICQLNLILKIIKIQIQNFELKLKQTMSQVQQETVDLDETKNKENLSVWEKLKIAKQILKKTKHINTPNMNRLQTFDFHNLKSNVQNLSQNKIRKTVTLKLDYNTKENLHSIKESKENSGNDECEQYDQFIEDNKKNNWKMNNQYQNKGGNKQIDSWIDFSEEVLFGTEKTFRENKNLVFIRFYAQAENINLKKINQKMYSVVDFINNLENNSFPTFLTKNLQKIYNKYFYQKNIRSHLYSFSTNIFQGNLWKVYQVKPEEFHLYLFPDTNSCKIGHWFLFKFISKSFYGSNIIFKIRNIQNFDVDQNTKMAISWSCVDKKKEELNQKYHKNILIADISKNKNNTFTLSFKFPIQKNKSYIFSFNEPVQRKRINEFFNQYVNQKLKNNQVQIKKQSGKKILWQIFVES